MEPVAENVEPLPTGAELRNLRRRPGTTHDHHELLVGGRWEVAWAGPLPPPSPQPWHWWVRKRHQAPKEGHVETKAGYSETKEAAILAANAALSSLTGWDADAVDGLYAGGLLWQLFEDPARGR